MKCELGLFLSPINAASFVEKTILTLKTNSHAEDHCGLRGRGVRYLWGWRASGIFQAPEWTLPAFSQDHDLKSQYNIDFICNCGKIHINKVSHPNHF